MKNDKKKGEQASLAMTSVTQDETQDKKQESATKSQGTMMNWASPQAKDRPRMK